MAKPKKAEISNELTTWVSEIIGSDRYVVCSDKLRATYFLYKVDEKSTSYLVMESKSPLKFEPYLEKRRVENGR